MTFYAFHDKKGTLEVEINLTRSHVKILASIA